MSWLLLVLVWLVLGVSLWLPWPSNQLRVVTCDVGQGDAMLMQLGFTQVLIDGGPTHHGVTACLRQVVAWWDRRLELVAATHSDQDHIGGLPQMLEYFQVETVVVNDLGKSNDHFFDWYQAVREQQEAGAVIVVPTIGQRWCHSSGWCLVQLSDFGAGVTTNFWNDDHTETVLSVVTSNQNQADVNHNDRSVSFFVHHHNWQMLLTGDLESTGEQALIDTWSLPKVQTLKAGHHGSKTSSTDDLLKIVQPESIMISSGQGNTHGHPSWEVLSRVLNYTDLIWRTDQLGSFELIVSAENEWLMREL